MNRLVGTDPDGASTGGSLRFDLLLAAATVAVASVLMLGSPDGFDTGWPEVAAGVGAFIAVALRRRWPLILVAVAVTWAIVHGAVFERPSAMVFASLVLLASAGMRIERRSAIGLGVAVGLVLYAMTLITTGSSFGDARSLIALAWTGVAIGVGDATRSWRHYRESAEAQMRSAVVAAEAQTRQQVSEERLSIARELHDLLAHSLSVMNVQTGAALHLVRSDPDGAEEALVAARDAGRSVLDELRELLSVLRQDDSDPDAPRSALPTAEDIPALVEMMRSTGFRVTSNETGAPRTLTPAVSLAAYRIVQEGLTNAAKHGNGSAELTLAWHDQTIAITVSNATRAPLTAEAPGPTAGHGLEGMRERAIGNGGTFEAGPTNGRFVVTAALPTVTDRSQVTR